MQTNCRRLSAPRAGLLVVDMQEGLFPAISGKERVLQNTLTLTRGAAILAVPVFVTEQYPKGLGATLPQVAESIKEFAPLHKLTFSACGASELVPALKTARVSDVILCGFEAHVCVAQTCLDLLDSAFRVFAVADATSSRTPENHRLGVERMRDAGAAIVSTEMVLFELLERAGTEQFKEMLKLVK
jgi:nicotinamidase-related amidase